MARNTVRQRVNRSSVELHNIGLDYDQVDRLQAIARSLHRLDEHNCNYGLTPRQEKREENLEEEAARIAKDCGLLIYRQGDPRGWPLYIYSQESVDGYNTRINAHYTIDAIYDSVGIAVCPL